jgi:hypothetical protein
MARTTAGSWMVATTRSRPPQRALAELGVPDARIHTERFDMV